MGLFDRIKGDTEEVELRVPRSETESSDRKRTQRSPTRGDRSREGEGQDDEERFLLPGMQPEAVQEPDEDDAVPDDDDLHAVLERIVQQNERIIRLLEDREGDDADAGIDGVL